jgi:chromosome segregation ATPase
MGAAITVVGVVVTGYFTYRGSRTAASIQAEPSQRAADLAAFQAIRDDLQQEVDELRAETRSLRSLVRAFAGYVSDLTTQMRGQGIEPPAPPDRVDEYNRTGV